MQLLAGRVIVTSLSGYHANCAHLAIGKRSAYIYSPRRREAKRAGGGRVMRKKTRDQFWPRLPGAKLSREYFRIAKRGSLRPLRGPSTDAAWKRISGFFARRGDSFRGYFSMRYFSRTDVICKCLRPGSTRCEKTKNGAATDTIGQRERINIPSTRKREKERTPGEKRLILATIISFAKNLPGTRIFEREIVKSRSRGVP